MKRILIVLLLLGACLFQARSLHAQQNGPDPLPKLDGPEAAWTSEDHEDLIAAIEGLQAHGLAPHHYSLVQLRACTLADTCTQERASRAWLAAAQDMLQGRVAPRSVEPGWTAPPRTADLNARLGAALRTGAIRSSLEQFAPTDPAYEALKAELASLREDAAEEVAPVSDGALLKPGMAGTRVREVQARLIQLGMLAPEGLTASMDAETVAAVTAFQAREHLEPDGLVGPATLRALNRTVADRIDQLRVNLERLRWLPDDLGARHLRVNIAAHGVEAVESGDVQRRHRLIVGRTNRQTPVFSGAIRYVVFNPWWETPRSLARSDLLRRFQRDPGAVRRQGFQVLDSAGRVVAPSTIDWSAVSASSFPYRLRQAPGPANALGQVKFIFPNRHNVYLHDTPSKELFVRCARAFSSGCLRVEAPLDLAEWVLAGTEEWGRARIDEAVASGKTVRADLVAPVPIHILYMTASVDETGSVRFLDDIYQRDPALLARLDAPR